MCIEREDVETIVGSKTEPVRLELIHQSGILAEIKVALSGLPCTLLADKITRSEGKIEHLEKRDDTVKQDIDVLYKMTRSCENNVTALGEQNKGQKELSAKAWALIIMGLNFVFMIAVYFITRGSN